MAPRHSWTTLLLTFLAAFAGTATILVATVRKAPSRPPAPTPSLSAVKRAESPDEMGRRLFRESATWIARGETPGPAVKSFHLALDAKLDLDGTHTDGPMSLWMQVPNLYRQQTTMSNVRHTQVLNADGLWSARPGTKSLFTRQSGEPELWQARNDHQRLIDLAMFLSLRGLDGPGVSFESEGEKKPSGTYAHPEGRTWRKIVRKAPGRPDISLWLDHTVDAAGVVHANYPGVVRVAGKPQNNIATEDYILQKWEDQSTDPKRTFRFPRTIRALQSRPGQAPYEFLRAAVLDIAVDAGIEPSVFSTAQAWISRPR